MKFEDFSKICRQNYKNNLYFTWRPLYICGSISIMSSLNEMFQARFVKKIKTQFMAKSFHSLPAQSRTVYEIMWKDMVETDKPHISVTRRMCFACWVTQTTDTNSEYVIFIAFRRQQWLCEHLSMLRICTLLLFFYHIRAAFLGHFVPLN